MNAVQSSSRVLDKNGKPIRPSDVKIPRNQREAMRSKYADFWRMAELEEMAALKAKVLSRRLIAARCRRTRSPLAPGGSML